MVDQEIYDVDKHIASSDTTVNAYDSLIFLASGVKFADLEWN